MAKIKNHSYNDDSYNMNHIICVISHEIATAGDEQIEHGRQRITIIGREVKKT